MQLLRLFPHLVGGNRALEGMGLVVAVAVAVAIAAAVRLHGSLFMCIAGAVVCDLACTGGGGSPSRPRLIYEGAREH